jgi:CheY-like chemotaxis protein
MTENARIRILAVEDNPDTQTLLRYLLRPHYDVHLVPHVEEALTAAGEGQFSLFVLDINLGEQRTGIDLLHRLRAMDAHRSTPALALTAYAMPGDRDRFLREGFDAYVSKPFTRNELLEAIEVLLLSSSQRD